METTKLKRFAQYARRTLREQVEAKMGMVLGSDSAARRENAKVVQDLEKQIKDTSKEHIIDKVAYTWFNRFCALRFMDVNRYSRIGVVSPLEGQFQPEILAEAKMGHIDEEMVPDTVRQQVTTLLNGSAPSRDPQQEAYRLLVVAACNDFYRLMPYLFERIADYTELLMPDDLLSGNSILAYTREAMTPDMCQDVEVIGWLYQFYISEKKEEVFEGLKKNKKIDPENIPAATQLFTPHWIVRYLVENSLGRLWLLNQPNSRLAENMNYYVKPQQSETDYPRISKPEDIKICDPACGSGHMLTYAFDLLYLIYEEVGTDPALIPEKILTHNLYGIEIDERAGELAAFALTMKARSKQRRFFNKRIQPNICILKNVRFAKGELDEYMTVLGRDLFTLNLRTTLCQFAEVDNFGSLVLPALTNVVDILPMLEAKDMAGQLFLVETHQRVLIALRQADYLSQKYQIVIANPPYLGGNGMNAAMRAFAQSEYPNSKADTFSMFIERGFTLAVVDGYSSMVTMETWMSLSRYESLRLRIFANARICSMVHMPYVGKGGTSMGINFGTSATIFQNRPDKASKADYSCVRYFETDGDGVPLKFPVVNEKSALASIYDLEAIPGMPVAYWVKETLRSAFLHKKVADIAETRLGMATADNNTFLRFWHECSVQNIGLQIESRMQAKASQKKWFPYQKGGDFRRWFGNQEYVVNWKNDGEEIQNFSNPETGKIRSHNYNLDFIFKEGITWSALTSSKTSFRLSNYALFDNAGSSLFLRNDQELRLLLGFLNGAVFNAAIEIISPSLNFQPGDIGKLPVSFEKIDVTRVNQLVKNTTDLARADWNSSETSWEFQRNPLIGIAGNKSKLRETYASLYSHLYEIVQEMRHLEEENNHIFIEAYGLQGELKSDVPLSEIALTCNPHYRYGGDKTGAELDAMLVADAMKEFISYAVGCMFGRYSLDKAGIILANQGESLDDYLREVPEPTFAPDADNVIPLLDGDWFTDDIAEHFRNFLRATFGDEHYEENQRFIEESLGKKGKSQSIRDYLLKDFYADHVKRYKKRPIYWLFSSPKGTFNALIYMHRYRPDTVSVVLNDYLREFRTKLAARKSHLEQVSISGSASASEKTGALKEIEILKKNIVELEGYERDVLYPLATQQLEIDLDDGVKANYGKFGAALKKIVGLDATED